MVYPSCLHWGIDSGLYDKLPCEDSLVGTGCNVPKQQDQTHAGLVRSKSTDKHFQAAIVQLTSGNPSS